MAPFFSSGLNEEALSYERVLKKKLDLYLIAISAHSRDGIEQLDSGAIDVLE